MDLLEQLEYDSIEELEELEELNNIVVEEERRRALEDLYFLDKHILGYKDMAPRTHKPVCMFADNEEYRKKLIMLPRGTFKSSCITIGLPIKRAAKNPDIRVLIDNEVYNNSKSFLREIKGHLENPRILELFPQLKPNKRINDGFTESTVIIEGRTKSRKEPTFSCAGLDQVKVGMHYDLIIMDDLVSHNNVTNKEQIEKVINHYKLALSLLDPGGELVVIGTRYHYSDLYGYILENEADSFNTLILPAILNEEAVKSIRSKFPDLPYTYEPDQLLFPERLTEDFLSEQRRSQGTYIYNCQYMLDPVNQEESDFRQEWIRYYRGYLKKNSNGKYELTVEWVGDHNKRALPDFQVPFTIPVRIFTTFDPANKKKKKTDFTGGSTIALGPHGEWFILNLIRDKYNPKQIVDRIMFEVEQFNPEVTGIEENGKETIRFYLVERMKQLNKFFRVKELKTRQVPKEDRIRRMIPRWENGMIFLPVSLKRKNWENKVVDLVEAFEDEYIHFPLAKHDDLMDALAYQEDMMPRVKKDDRGRRKGRAQFIG